MKFPLLVACWLLLEGINASAQMQRAPQLSQKMRVTDIEVDGKTIMVPGRMPGVFLKVSAQIVQYQSRGDVPFDRTLISGDAKVNSGSSTQSLIRGRKILLDTDLSELQIDAGECFEDAPWKVLRDSLDKAPHTPRFRLQWYATAFNNTDTCTLVYDRRTKELAIFRWSNSVGRKPEHGRQIEKGVTEAKIQQRAQGN